jgi:hypothetical protein
LTIRQSKILKQPTRVYPGKRKAVKSPNKAARKKPAKIQKTTAPRSSKKPRVRKIVLRDLDDEEKEQADLQAALEKVEAQKKKEQELKDTYQSGIDPEVFDDMYSKLNLPERDILRNKSDSIGMYEPINGKFSDFLAHSTSYRNVFKKFLRLKLNVSLIEFSKVLFLRKIPIFLRNNLHQNRLTHTHLTLQNLKIMIYLMMQHKPLVVLHQSFIKWMMKKILKEHHPHYLPNMTPS